jgi:uncharacterized protein (DUF2249 family)
MGLLPNNAQEISLEGATVPFYKYEENEAVVYQFDTSKCGHPEPMINAMIGLQTIQDGEKLVMINHKAPMGLFAKIEADFNHDVQELEDDKGFKMTFSKKSSQTTSTNFNDNNCSGGGCSA